MRRYLLPGFLLVSDILMIISASVMSLFMRFDDIIFDQYIPSLVVELPALIGSYVLFFFMFRIYRRIWRYAGIKELLAIVMSSLCGAVLFWSFTDVVGIVIPRSVHLMTLFIVIASICSSRLALRYFIMHVEKKAIMQQ